MYPLFMHMDECASCFYSTSYISIMAIRVFSLLYEEEIKGIDRQEYMAKGLHSRL
jgi:hypothetical protein